LIGFRTKIVFAIVASSLVALGGLVLFLLMPELFKSWEFLVGSIVALTEGAGASGIIERHWHESLDFLSRHVRFYALPILMAMGAGLIARSRLFENSPDKKRVAIFWSVAAVLVAEIVLIVVRDAMVAGIRGRVNGMLGYSSLFVVLANGPARIRKDDRPPSCCGFSDSARVVGHFAICDSGGDHA
jgi:hypothetical protein